MDTLFDASKLREDILPTELDVYNHYLYLNKVKIENGDWKQNTTTNVKVQCVRSDVAEIWNRSGIPHDCKGRAGEKRILNLVNKCKNMTKAKAMEKIKEGFGDDLKVLCDVAICKHLHIA